MKIRPYVDIFCEKISIGSNTDVGTRTRFGGNIEIRSNVMIGPNNYISSVDYNYENVDFPIINAGTHIINKNGRDKLIICDDSWIAFNCALIGGIKIGKHSIVGANSVVTKDVPDYCIVVRDPARVIKRYNFHTGQWENVK